jgi:hypothetical protein
MCRRLVSRSSLIAANQLLTEGSREQLESPIGTTVVTGGPAPQAGNIIPQMFVSFRGEDKYPFRLSSNLIADTGCSASSVYLITAPSSNATANITIALTYQPSFTISINASNGGAGIVNLDESFLTSLSVTYLPGTNFTQLALQYVVLTVSDPKYVIFLHFRSSHYSVRDRSLTV